MMSALFNFNVSLYRRAFSYLRLVIYALENSKTMTTMIAAGTHLFLYSNAERPATVRLQVYLPGRILSNSRHAMFLKLN